MDCPWTVHGHGQVGEGPGVIDCRVLSLWTKARRLLYKLTTPFTIQAYHTVYYTSLPHRLLYKLTAPILYKLTAPTLYKLTTPTLYGVPGVPGTLGSLGPRAPEGAPFTIQAYRANTIQACRAND